MRLWPRRRDDQLERSLAAWQEWMTYQGVGYALPAFSYGPASEERVDPTFTGYAQSMFRANSVIFACMAVRSLLFQEARFQFRWFRNGRPGDLFGTAELRLLELPAPNQTTRDLLARMIQDVDLCGNSYSVVRNGQ